MLLTVTKLQSENLYIFFRKNNKSYFIAKYLNKCGNNIVITNYRNIHDNKIRIISTDEILKIYNIDDDIENDNCDFLNFLFNF
jgi:hypothetical protein